MQCQQREAEIMEIRARETSVTGKLGYLLPQEDRPFNYMCDPGPSRVATNCRYERKDCCISNARLAPSAPALDVNGFALYEARSSVTSFYDDEQVTRTYYREVEELALQLTKGRRAVVFDHQRRQREAGRPELGFGRHGDGSKPAALGRVHNDYTERSGRRRLNMVLPDADPEVPFLIVNFWRPVLHPAIDTPLAVCDARSVHDEDWVETDIIYPDRRGEIYLVRYSPEHRWHYYPEMHPDEVLVFKTFDSRTGAASRMVPHCAFDDPVAPEDAPLRRSIEIRCLVTLD